MLDALDVEADRVLCTGGFFGGWGGGARHLKIGLGFGIGESKMGPKQQ